jgi:EmrB/QacA subfamily drug resistance transporter
VRAQASTNARRLRARLATHPRRRWFALVVVASGMWLSVMNISIVNIAMPSMARDLGVDLPGIAWVVTGFFVAQATLLPIAGRAGDLYGRRRVFIAGVVVLIAGSILCAAAWSAGSLIAFRVVQAAGACGMAPTAVSYIGELFAPRERGQALGILSAVVSIAPIFALNTAGALLAVFGWRSVFWFTPIVGAFVLAGALIVLPEFRGPAGPRSFDLAGAALGGVGLLGLLLGVSRGESWGFASPATIACLVAGGVGLWLFVLRERRAADPLLNLALLRLRSVTASSIAAWASAAALFGVLVLLPFYMTRVLGFGPIALGLAISPIALSFIVVSPLAGRAFARTGPARMATGGYVVSAVGALAAALAAGSESYAAIAPGIVLFGVGLAMASSPITTSAISEVRNDQLGVASALSNISRNTGGALGTAVLGVIMHAALPPGTERGTERAISAVRELVTGGFRHALFAAAGFLAVAALAAMRLPRIPGLGAGVKP